MRLNMNPKLTKCMGNGLGIYVYLSLPQFVLDGSTLTYTDVTKYLGCFISNKLTDDCEINHQVRNVYFRGNILIKKFRHCTVDVKIKFCLTVYVHCRNCVLFRLNFLNHIVLLSMVVTYGVRFMIIIGKNL